KAAVGLALESDGLRGVLRHRVEDRTQLRILRGDFKDFASLNPSGVDLVIEVDGSRRVRRDPLPLETCLAEDEGLRRNRNVQFLQERPEITVRPLELDLPPP